MPRSRRAQCRREGSLSSGTGRLPRHPPDRGREGRRLQPPLRTVAGATRPSSKQPHVCGHFARAVRRLASNRSRPCDRRSHRSSARRPPRASAGATRKAFRAPSQRPTSPRIRSAPVVRVTCSIASRVSSSTASSMGTSSPRRGLSPIPAKSKRRTVNPADASWRSRTYSRLGPTRCMRPAFSRTTAGRLPRPAGAVAMVRMPTAGVVVPKTDALFFHRLPSVSQDTIRSKVRRGTTAWLISRRSHTGESWICS